MSWPYKKVLVIGATSGIGEALAARCVQAGSKVIVSGRREEKLVDFVNRHGEETAFAAPLDVTALDKIPEFAAGFIIGKYEFRNAFTDFLKHHQKSSRFGLRHFEFGHPTRRGFHQTGLNRPRRDSERVHYQLSELCRSHESFSAVFAKPEE